MDKNFKIKKEREILIQQINNIYIRISDTYKNMVVLNKYCNAYKNREGLYYLVPFTKILENSLNEITEDLHKIINKDTSLTKDYFITQTATINNPDLIVEE